MYIGIIIDTRYKYTIQGFYFIVYTQKHHSGVFVEAAEDDSILLVMGDCFSALAGSSSSSARYKSFRSSASVR